MQAILKFNRLLLISLSLFALDLNGQQIDLEHFEALAPRSIGPAGMSGRVTTIDVVNRQSNRIYIGTASGGVWYSGSGGINWEPIFEDAPLQSIGALAINQSNPDEIWVGTGEGNPRNSHNSGGGIFKSIDGGKNWKRMGLENTKTIHRIIIHRDNPDIVYAAALGSAWGPNSERGVFRTKDGGDTWEKVLFVNDSTGCADLVVDPSNPNKLIAAMWEFGRKPWFFTSGGEGSGLYISFDGGKTWEERTSEDGLPKGELGRMGLAIAPSKPNIVYALIEAKKNGFYKSTDGGFNWKLVSTENIGNRPFYYADIFADPQNENRVFNLWSYLSKSEDGGKTFERFGRGTHPDHHAFWVHPDNPAYMMEGNDGGLNISHDGGETWRFVQTLPLAQFYHISYDMDIPYHIAGGMQDNGSWVGPSAVWEYGGIQNTDWQEVYFGDGFDVVFRPDNNRYVYAMSQGGNVSYIDRETGKSRFVKPVHPKGEELRFNWNAAIAQNPFHDCGIYFGSQYVHKSMDCGLTWQIISPDLTTNDSTKQRQFESGGLTIDDTRAENFTSILAIAPSPVREDVIWVGTDDGHLQLTQDGGQSWAELSDQLKGARPGSWIPYIEVSEKNAGEAFVIVNDYRRNDWRPMAFHTNDFGQTFTRIVDEEQVEGFALSIIQDPEVPNLLWLGTDYGLYFSMDTGENWQQWDQGFPSTPVQDLQLHPREKDLIIGTFGRSAWVLDDTRPVQEIARSEGALLQDTFRTFPVPDAYLANYKSYEGSHFPADGEFSGKNRSPYARITVWQKPAEEEEGDDAEDAASKKEADTSETEEPKGRRPGKEAKVVVLNTEGDTIRRFSEKLKPGMNRFTWDLRAEGVRFPSRRAARPDADPPRGYQVMPGRYRLVIHNGDFTDSTEVTVHADPRLDVDLADLRAEQAAYQEFYELVEQATAAFTRLQEARKAIKRVEEALVYAPDSTLKAIKKQGEALQDSITQLEERYMLPEDFKGIRRSTGLLNSTLYGVYSYLDGVEGSLAPMGRLMLDQAKAETAEVTQAIEDFFETDFASYRKAVEQVPYTLFEE
ncbi:MAG: hypothetical protein RIC19_18500 [Phaeodactylibacter sp.]|uniref:WD40/YVTN/BNR-like repeat-containing protein n=1 Tax=Phaeodactylibacter sp. TaxID=1940289 RepID=UPI0032EE80DA